VRNTGEADDFTSPRRGEVDGERSETAGEGPPHYIEGENPSPGFLAPLAIRPLPNGASFGTDVAVRVTDAALRFRYNGAN